MAVPTKDHQINGYTVTTKYCTTCRQEGPAPGWGVLPRVLPCAACWARVCERRCFAGSGACACPWSAPAAPAAAPAAQPLPPAALLALRRVRQLRGQV